MARIHSLFSVEEPAGDPARDLVGGGDDFAVTVASRLDGRFWVRVERMLDGDAVVVTDMMPGERPRAELAAGLAMAVRGVSSGRVGALAFRDLVPAGAQAALYPARIVQAADLAKQVGAVVAESLATSVAAFEMMPRRGKIDARMTLAPPRAP